MEEQIKSVLNFEASGKAHPISSPRSLEACLRSGFDPKELMPRPRKAFVLPNETKEMCNFRVEHSEERRKWKIEVVSRERQRIIEFLESPETKDEAPAEVGGDRARPDIKEEATQMKAGILEMERKRLITIKKRQEREVKRVLENEERIAELHAKIVKAEEMEHARREIHEKEVAEARVKSVEKRRQLDLEKRAKEEEEAVQRQQLAKRDKDFQLKLLAAERQAAKLNAAKALEREREKKEKADSRRAATQSLMKMHDDEAERSRLRVETREARVAAQLNEKKRAKASEIAEQRAAAEKRIQHALERNKKMQENKRKAYEQKQEHAAARAEERLEKDGESMKKRLEVLEKQDAQRLQRLADNYQRRQDRRKDIVSRLKEKEKFYGTLREQREHEEAMKKIKQELSMQDKQQNIERIHRIEEFIRLQTEQKIIEEEERCERIKAEREFMIEERKKATRQATRQRHDIKTFMEKVKANPAAVG